MALFFNQRKPKEFNYIPRNYDPTKEAREQRKKEVLGERYKAPGENDKPTTEYVPGSYLREHVQVRRSERKGEIIKRHKRAAMPIMVVLVALVVLLFVAWMMYFK
jgi:predicted nucleic acid-binding Zn ribbon protein